MRRGAPARARYDGGVRRALPVLLFVVGCEPSRPAAAPTLVAGDPAGEEDVAFVRSEKLAEDVQELVVRAYEAEVPFVFEVRVARPLDAVTRTRFAERGVELLEDLPSGHVARARVGRLGVLTGDERVRAVTCAPPPPPEGPLPADEVLRRKLSPEVRVVVGAASACWFEVRVRWATEPDEAERAFLEAHGARIVAWDREATVAWVPVRLLPHVAGREAALSIETHRR